MIIKINKHNFYQCYGAILCVFRLLQRIKPLIVPKGLQFKIPIVVEFESYQNFGTNNEITSQKFGKTKNNSIFTSK
jgi:hypothetical protein